MISKIISVALLLLVAAKGKANPQHKQVIQSDSHEATTTLEDSFNDLPPVFGNSVNSSRLNGGELVKRIVPFQVSLQVYRRNSWRHFCGGSIITHHHVLTAAHCVHRMNVKDIRIVAGTLTWQTGGQRCRATAKSVHPRFSLSPKIINDIAVLKVQPAFNVRHNSIGTVSLGSTSRVGARVQVRVTGWGATTPTAAGGLANDLQQLDYQTITNEECRKRGFGVTWREICALSAKGQGSCMGDSGGPLVTRQGPLQLVGVVSYGSALCAQGRPDVYSRVSTFLPYIAKALNSEIP